MTANTVSRFRHLSSRRNQPGGIWAASILRGLLVLALLLEAATPSVAGIMKTKRKRPQARGTYREIPLVIGSGIEFTTDSEETEYGFPVLAEYAFSEAMKIAVEYDWSYLSFKNGEKAVRGFGDLETALTYEFITERRKRPAFATEAVVKWPTAKAEIGTGKADYSLGAVVSKDLIKFDLDFNAVYTVVGKPPGSNMKDTGEVSIAAECRMSRLLDVEAEILANTGSGGGFRGRSGSIGGIGGGASATESGGTETEGTLGVAEHINPKFKLEEGVILNTDGSWQIVTAWEWDFGEGE